MSEAVVKALCWTFLHSIWQGFLLAIVTAIVIMATRKQTAALRYNVLCALLMLFMLGAGFTFAHEFRGLTNASPAAAPATAGATSNLAAPISAPETAAETSIETFVHYFNQHAALIVTIWFIVFLAKAVQLLSGLVYLQKIRYSQVAPPDRFWQRRLTDLSAQLGLGASVKLLESGLIKVPVAMGIIKPVILLPFGLLANLPPDQVEAILLHELAHIKRGDYFVNLIQSLAEIFFFFNPAVLWVSSLIRNERENCCDDMALQQTKSKAKFIHALVAFQEYTQRDVPMLATAFPGSARKTFLLDRAERIIYNKNKTLNNMEKLSVVFCMIFVFTLLAFLSAPERSSAMPPAVPIKVVSIDGTMKVDTSGRPVKTGTQRVLGNPIVTTPEKNTAQKDVVKELIAELQAENLIKAENLETTSIKLTSTELNINGIRQSDQIQKRLSDKYITSPDMKIMYHWWGE